MGASGGHFSTIESLYISNIDPVVLRDIVLDPLRNDIRDQMLLVPHSRLQASRPSACAEAMYNVTDRRPALGPIPLDSPRRQDICCGRGVSRRVSATS